MGGTRVVLAERVKSLSPVSTLGDSGAWRRRGGWAAHNAGLRLTKEALLPIKAALRPTNAARLPITWALLPGDHPHSAIRIPRASVNHLHDTIMA